MTLATYRRREALRHVSTSGYALTWPQSMYDFAKKAALRAATEAKISEDEIEAWAKRLGDEAAELTD